MALFAVLMCVNFASCSSDDVIPNEPQKPKEYTVSLGFTGEISISESPLSRASENNLYGIQVYSCPNNGTSTTYSYYAYGLFDDTSLINIKLLEGYKYKFVATMVVDGKNAIKSTNNVYSSPFNSTSLDNKFIYSKDEHIAGTSGVSVGNVHLVGHTRSYVHPNINRFYGETTDYIPESNKNVEIDMKRMAFGIKYVSDLLEGSLKIALEGAPEVVITYPETGHEDIYAFQYIQAAFNKEEQHSEQISTTITWTKDDGVVIPLGTHNITFKRNILTTITIKVADITTENGIGITLENKEMDTENITIENGEIVDTNVNTGTEE